jgi:hypothetical protein
VRARGVFRGVGRVAELVPPDAAGVSRDDLVFRSGTTHVVSTPGTLLSSSVNPHSCLFTGTQQLTWNVTGGTGQFAAATGSFTGTVSAVALLVHDRDGSCSRALSPPPAHAEALGYRDDLRPVRSFVASRARRAGLTPLRIPDLVLAVSELAANTLHHTGGGGTVHFWRTSDRIIIRVPSPACTCAPPRHADGKHDHKNRPAASAPPRRRPPGPSAHKLERLDAA